MKISRIYKSKNEKDFVKNAEEYAGRVGIKLNPDAEKIAIILKGFFKNKKEKGEFYCPCRVVSGDKKKDKEIICPCVFHRGEIELEKHCRCFLFFSK